MDKRLIMKEKSARKKEENLEEKKMDEIEEGNRNEAVVILSNKFQIQ